MYYWIEPEVAGGIGPGTVFDEHHDLVGDLRYEFQDWFGDDIVSSSRYWIVTERLAQAIETSELTGWSFAPVIVTRDEQWVEFSPDVDLPSWRRLIPTGTREADDFGVWERTHLAISDRALDLLRQFNISQAKIGSIGDHPDGLPRLTLAEVQAQLRNRRNHD